MMKKIFCIGASAAFLLPMVICSDAPAQFRFDGDAHRRAMRSDPVGIVLLAYDDANDEFRKLENPTPDATLAYRQEWRDRLEKIKAEHPQSEFVVYVRSQLLQLSNDLNELDKSQAVVRELIDASETQEEKYLWYHELGTISERRHQETQDESDLQKSKEAFERANELFSSFSPETQKQIKRLLSPEEQDDDIPELLDPIQEAFVAYDVAVNEFRENPSPAARLTHRQEWRDRFEKVIADNPNSMSIGAARRQLLGLYNGLDEYDKSQTLLHVMVSEATIPEEKVFFLNQLGTVSRLRYLSSQDQSDSQKSREAFEQANELFLSLPPERQEGRLGGDQIINLGSAAAGARDAGDHERSAMLYRNARELYQSLPENAAHAASVCGLESIANQEMNQWIRVKKAAEALKCLEILSNLPSARWSPSYYALNYATQWYEKDSKGFQDFVSNWLAKNDFDERTPILMACLGFSYFDDKIYDKALPIYETLRDKHRGDFQRLETKAFEQGSGGHYEQILYHLSVIYSQGNDRGKIESVKTEMVNLLPESPFVKFLTGQNRSEVDWTPPERASYLWLRILSAVTGIVLILLALYLNWRKGI
jgi:hypothetical protein